ncbi:MAG TPA: 3'-5' exonuclease [Myxococcales bacterium]
MLDLSRLFLEQNYRSTGAILEAANAVIGKNPGRKAKRLWTDRGRGANVRVVCAPDDDAEARYVADEVLRIAYEDKVPLGEIAVLYRTNAHASSGRGFDDASAESSAEGVANLEEERRLAYVGMTRARERLTLTRAAQRLRRGKLVPRTPSRFLDDLPAELVDLSGPAAPAGEAQTRKARSFFADMDTLLSRKNPEGGER